MSSAIPYPSDSIALSNSDKETLLEIKKNIQQHSQSHLVSMQKEPKYVRFFQDIELNLMLQWIAFTTNHYYTEEQIQQIESSHSLRIANAANYSYMDLTWSDAALLNQLLNQNIGDSRHLESIREFITSRSHSLVCISHMLTRYVFNQPASGSVTYNIVSYILYIINNLFLHCPRNSITSCGLYTKYLLKQFVVIDFVSIFLSHLPIIFKIGYNNSTSEEDRRRLYQLIEFWINQSIITRPQGDFIKNMMVLAVPITPPPIPTFMSPYPQALPPPNIHLANNNSSTANPTESMYTQWSNRTKTIDEATLEKEIDNFYIRYNNILKMKR